MDRYTIFCTPEITRKAIDLGAPIERGHESSRYFNIGVPTFFDDNDEICRVKNSVIFIPTAEQLICWLEEHGIATSISRFRKNYGYSVSIFENNSDINIAFRTCIDSNMSFREATIAAIDAALEYLENNK